MMQAMKYELLIREVFRCGRTMRYGADADIYRGLEKTSLRSSGQSRETQYNRGFSMGVVSAHLRTALYELQGRHKDNEDFRSNIDEYLANLSNASEVKDIDKCIDDAWEAIQEIKKDEQ